MKTTIMGFYRGYKDHIGIIMDKKMETTVMGLYRGYIEIIFHVRNAGNLSTADRDRLRRLGFNQIDD